MNDKPDLALERALLEADILYGNDEATQRQRERVARLEAAEALSPDEEKVSCEE